MHPTKVNGTLPRSAPDSIAISPPTFNPKGDFMSMSQFGPFASTSASGRDGFSSLLIDAKAAARVLALGSRTLWTLTKCNAVPARRIGRAVRYCPAELRAWIALGCPTEPGSAERVRKAVRG